MSAADSALPVARLRYIKADLQVATGPRSFTVHTVGWLPGEGWFCTCAVARCGHVRTVADAIAGSAA